MKEIMGKAVEDHVNMCDTLVADLVDGLMEADEAIESAKLLGIEMDYQEPTPEGKMLVEEYKNKQLAKIDDPNAEKPVV